MNIHAGHPWLQVLLQRLAAGFISFPHGSDHTLLLRAAAPLFGFRYDAQLRPDEFRLIRLPPAIADDINGTTASPPTFTIHTFSLTQPPPYIALSYTWGPALPPKTTTTTTAPQPPPSRKVLITLNNRPFPVLTNLFEALARIAAARPGEYLWVDGVCINQDDVAERSAQVRAMDLVYSGARETIVWLGEGTPAAERAMPKLEAMAGPTAGAEERILDWGRTQTFGDAFVADNEEQLARNGLPPMTSNDWTDIGDIVSRAWFGRVWIIQEVALSRNPTILIGPHALPWSTLGNAALIVLGSNAMTALYGLDNGGQNHKLVEGLVFASNLHTLREWCRGDESPFKDVIASTDYASGIQSDTLGTALLNVLMISKGSMSTVRQDRVYGLLGILNHIAKTKGLPLPDIKVDYKSSSDHVLAALGSYLYQETRSLNLLSLAGEASRSATSHLPTWIPTFENVNHPILGPNYTSLRPYNASTFTNPLLRLDEPSHTLHVQVAAPTLGSIEELGETWPELLQGQFLKSIAILLHCGNTYSPTGEPIVEAFWRTLILDSNLTSRPAPPALSSSFKSWFNVLSITAILKSFNTHRHLHDIFDALEPLFTLADNKDATSLLPKSQAMYEFLCSLGAFSKPGIQVMTEQERNAYMARLGEGSSTYEGLLRLTLLIARRLVRTVRGYLCLTPVKAEVGDRIMVVKGCSTPLVLRRVNETPDTFKVIGDVYVHGVMFGEHITDDTVWRDVNLV